MALTTEQRSARNEIYDYGRENDYEDEDIQIALDVAYIESTVGLNLSNSASTASGLFQYLIGTWNDNHSGLGSRENQSNQIQAFYNDLTTYRDWFYDPEKNSNIPPSLSFPEYVYIKHHDGRS